LTGGVCIKLLTKLRHNQRSPLARLHIRHHKPIGIRALEVVILLSRWRGGRPSILRTRRPTMAADPISRLEVVQREIDRVFGDGHAAAHPELVIAVVNAASSDWAASRLAVAIERVAEALLVEEEAQQRIVPARELLRARPCSTPRVAPGPLKSMKATVPAGVENSYFS
jgi:hypothetical protein